MKKLLTLFAILMMALTSWADGITAVEPTAGDGTKDNPYEIASAGNLVWFANQVNSGSTTICGKLKADIDLGTDQTMIGSHEHPYKGTFDGDEHTVTVNYSSGNVGTYDALFSFIDGANITRVATTGTISSSTVTGGIASYANNSTISCCVSNIHFTISTDMCAVGGIVGNMNDSSNKVTDCLFYGKLEITSSVKEVGGIVGSAMAGGTITNCLFANNATGNTYDIIGLSDKCTITNCYYTKLGTEMQGTLLSPDAVTGGMACYNLNNKVHNGSQLWYQVIGTDDVPMPFYKSDGTVYGGDDACPASLSYSNKTHTLGTETATTDGITKKLCQNEGCEGKVVSYEEPVLDAEGFYNIGNLGNLISFAKKVNGGDTKINGKLTADIVLGKYQTMIGTNDNKFAGEFDGGNHTVKVNYITGTIYAAMFRYITDSNIHDLHTTGSISTSAKHAAGIVGTCFNSTIKRCQSDVAINSIVDGDAAHGGIVAYIHTASTVQTCMYNGAFSGSYSTNCGGIVGWSGDVAQVSNCLYINKGMFNTSGASTIARGNNVTIHNCYYTKAFGTAQGTKISAASLATGEACVKLNNGVSDGTQTWFQTLGQDTLPSFDTTHKTVYSGADVCPLSTSAGYSNTTHSVTGYGTDGVAACQNEGCGKEVYQAASYDDATGCYNISTKGNLLWFANQVNGGMNTINGRLTSDIDLGDSQTMIGTASNPFTGVFSGNKHTVTVNYTASDNYTALFQYTNGATISNLRTAGNIVTSYDYPTGIVAYSENTTVRECVSTVGITSYMTEGHIGGIVGFVNTSGTISGCLFSGTAIAVNKDNAASWVKPSFAGIVGNTKVSQTISSSLLISRSGNDFNSTTSMPIACGTDVMTDSCYFCYESDNCNKFDNAQNALVTYQQVLSGEVCYKLNSQVSDGTQVWYQTIGQEPAPDNTLPIVYGGNDACPNTLDYSNSTHNFSTQAVEETGKIVYTCQNNGCSYLYSNMQIPEYNEGTNTYILRNNEQLEWFASKVNSGECNTANAQVTKDLSFGDGLTIGNSTYNYSGTFDGNYHTIYIHKDGDNYGINAFALFRNTNGATIKHVITKGTSTLDAIENVISAGIVAYAKNTLIEGCSSSLTIFNMGIGPGGFYRYCTCYMGGIVGNADASTRINNCSFTGSFSYYINNPQPTICGLIAAKSESGTTISNCFAAASYKTHWFDDNGDLHTEARSATYSLTDTATITNCYYMTGYGKGAGTVRSASEFASGNVCMLLNNDVVNGSQAWHQNLGSDKVPVLLSTHGTVYAGSKACPEPSLYSNKTHDYGTHEEKSNGCHFTVCWHDDCSGCYEYDKPAYDEDTKTYLLANKGNVCWLAQQINLTKIVESNSKLVNDIDMTYHVYPAYVCKVEEHISPLGRYAAHPFIGTLDGQGHSIKNLTLDLSEGGVGLIGCASGTNTVIKNIIIDASCSISSTSGKGVAGLIGEVKPYNGIAANITLENCGNNASVTGIQNVAGIIGGVYDDDDNVITLTNCYNTGAINGQEESATLCGYARSNYTFTNCYNSGTLKGGTQLYRNADDGNHCVTNCYDFNGEQGDGVAWIAAGQVSSGTLCRKLNANGTVYSQKLGTDFHPVNGTEGVTGRLVLNISDADSLVALAKIVNSGVCLSSYTVNINSDIDLKDVSFPTIGRYATTPYMGTLDGHGHSIKNMTIDLSEGGVGLIGCASGTNTIIKNIIIDASCSVSSSSGMGVAGLVGEVKPFYGTAAKITLENCGNNASVTGIQNVAGILGGVYDDDDNVITLTNCYNTGAINGQEESATLCGYARRNYTFTNCYNSGTLTGGTQLYRYADDGKHTVTNCFDINGKQGDGVAKTTVDQVISGDLCRLLNANETVYSQKLGTNFHPVNGTEGVTGSLVLNISDADSLVALANIVNSGINLSSYTVNINSDIDLKDVSFPIIGRYAKAPFMGTLDGHGHSIKNMTIDLSEGGIGLIGCASGKNTVIKNIIIDSSCSVSSTDNGVAGLVGEVKPFDNTAANVTIENCGNEASVTGKNNVAGILGGVYDDDDNVITITKCYNTGAINGKDESASLCGYARKNYTITNCYNSGSLAGVYSTYCLYYTLKTGGETSVTDSYDVNGSQTGVSKITSDQVASGELCFILNGNKAKGDWGQTAADSYPVPSGAGMQHYSRTMEDQWGTICLPFAAETGDDYTFYEIKDVSNDVITLTKVKTLTAGTPAIIRRKDSVTDIDISASSTDFAETPKTVSSVKGLMLIGSFVTREVTNANGYIIDNNVFCKIADIKGENKVYCLPFYAWLSGSVASGAEQLTLDENTSTAVETINAITGGTAEYYDLNGRKLNDLQQGVNILKMSDGTTKKVLVK